ncbi:glycosyl hydrolase family 18 protein [Nocardia sp. NRRL S-836]|uniref:glycosyl hydrolase family 18 protein n=1 Tax=Nocardia sp. NRRL S-836 TaxID=1519492 RepID=UPI0006AD8FCA|nr:glycosyl hydrolase family 18 protein [Nocardia sp. NRRL S-836]KOV82719.1 chitinase [Nocardia sp. NRRL S-836]
MKKLFLALLLVVLAAPPATAATQKRTVVYYQTQYSNGATGTYVSPKPLVDRNTGVTDLLVAAIHLNDNRVVHLNDHPPSHSRYAQMWQDLAAMQARGVNVIGMVGGAAPGSFQRLDTRFSEYYPLLRDTIRTYKLNGVDLDVEEQMSIAGIRRVIDALKADFGAGFIITLSPVASALRGGGNLSGFSYEDLYRSHGSKIAYFNGQFYNGWGSAASTANYDQIISRGLIPANKVVLGTLTNPANGGSGYVSTTTLRSTVTSLKTKYPNFGGVAGWEYFNSLPGGTAAPWQWASEVTAMQR